MAATDEEIRNRFAYHPADTKERINSHEAIRSAMGDMAVWLSELLPESREKSLALTALQETAMWSNAAIAIHLPHADPAAT